MKKSIACVSCQRGRQPYVAAPAYLSQGETGVLHFVNSPRQAEPVNRDSVLSELFILVALTKSCQVYMLERPNSESDMLRRNSCGTDKGGVLLVWLMCIYNLERNQYM